MSTVPGAAPRAVGGPGAAPHAAGDGAPLVGVLALQGGVDEHLAALADAGARTRAVRLPGELEGLDAIVIPGGESTVLRGLAGALGLLGPLRGAVEGGLPVLATCAGLVLCAGGPSGGPGVLDVDVRRNAFGPQLASFETRLDVEGVGADVEAVFIRAPVVVRVGPAGRVIATVDGRVVGVRQGAVTALSFHPELTADRRVHRAFVERVRR